MPRLSVNGAELHYDVQGSGAQTIVFAHGLLWSGEMFAAQVAALRDRYRCITFDFRGQGRSEVTAGGYDMETLAADAGALIEALGAVPCHFAGLSMGGFVGLRLAARRPELLRSLILLETSADPEPRENLGKYRMMAWIARTLGTALVAGHVMPIMFGQTFLRDPGRAAQRDALRAQLLALDRKGVALATRGVIERAPMNAELSRIALPVLVIVGEEDVATPPAKSEALARGIAGATLVRIPGAGHTSTIEQPEQVTRAIETFLAAL